MHNNRQTRYLTVVPCFDLLFTWFAGVRFVRVAAYVSTASKKDGVRSVKLSWDIRITPTHGPHHVVTVVYVKKGRRCS